MTATLDFEELLAIQAEVDRIKEESWPQCTPSRARQSLIYAAASRLDATLAEIDRRENPHPRFRAA